MMDLVGQKFGRLTVEEFAGMDKGRHSYWNCLCDCGNSKKVAIGNLKSGGTKSCGCLLRDLLTERNTTHGQSKRGLMSREYRCWSHMIERCCSPKHEYYKHYGGRGIKVCDRWLGKEGFTNFSEDMGKCPKGMTLDRKNNDGDYTLENCRWATWREQGNNRRDNNWIEYEGERRTLVQWERHLGMKISTLSKRLNELGWSIERALTTPVGSP